MRSPNGDIRRLSAYDWPGNVRELENVIERAAILARGGRLQFDLPALEARLNQRIGNEEVKPNEPDLGVLTEDARRRRDRDNIIEALRRSGGKVFGAGGAAELLGVRPTTLASRIKALGIDRRAQVGSV